MFLSVCTDPNLLTVMIFFRRSLDLLEIIAPLGIIIFSLFDILKAVKASDQDEIKKKTKIIPKRLLAGILIFLSFPKPSWPK